MKKSATIGEDAVSEKSERDELKQNAPCNGDTVVRDNLAVIRTALANERTLLAYLRTGLALGAAGTVFVKFMDSATLVACGWGLMTLGGAVLLFGGIRFRKTMNTIERASRLG